MGKHVANIAKSVTASVHLVTCEGPDGRNCYYYLIATQEKIRELSRIKNDIFNVYDYGEVVASGFGIPSAEVKAAIAQKYGAAS